MSKPMTVARYAKEHRGWFYGCLLLFALVAFFCLKAIYDMTAVSYTHLTLPTIA